MRSSLGVRVCAAGVLLSVGALGCASEFSTEPPVSLRIERSSTWPAGLTVSDTALARFTLVHSVDGEVVPPRATWQSSDGGVLRIEALPATTGDPVADSLAARRTRVRLIATGAGTAQVTISIDGTAGIAATQETFDIVVDSLRIRRSAGHDTLSVSEIDTVRVRIQRASGDTSRTFRLTWRSSDASVARIEPLASNTGNAIADSLAAKGLAMRVVTLGPGTAELTATAEGTLGLELPSARFSVAVLPVHVERQGMPDAIPVSDRVLLGARVVNSLGRIVGSATLSWTSSSDTSLALSDLASPAPATGARLARGLSNGRVLAAPVTTRASTTGSHAIFATARARGRVNVALSAIGADNAVVATLTVPILVMERWVQVVGFLGRTCGLTIRGYAYCWGATIGTETPVLSDGPRLVVAPFEEVGLRLKSLVAGQNHVCGESAVAPSLWYCWGLNFYGQLTNGSTLNEIYPVAMGLSGMLLFGLSVSDAASCGVGPATLSVGLEATQVFCWGLPGPAVGPVRFEYAHPESLSPVDPADGVGLWGCGFSGVCFAYASVSVGTEHACANYLGRDFLARRTESVVCWGTNTFGQIGRPLSTTSRNTADVVYSVQTSSPDPLALTSLVSLPRSTCLVDRGDVYCWGERVGPVPTRVATNTGITVLSGSRDGDQICGSRVLDGSVWCFATSTGQVMPSIGGDSDGRPVYFSSVMTAGRVIQGTDLRHYCAISTPDGALYCWGNNTFRQLGSNSNGVALGLPHRVRDPDP